MMDRASDSGYELVLDNRRLIIAFAVLVLLFGCFFVLGFVEGKRQGYQAGSQIVAETAATPAPGKETPASETPSPSPNSVTEAPKDKPDERPLEWYKSVSGKGEKPEIGAPAAAAPSPASKDTVSKPAIAPPGKAAGTPVSKPPVKAASAPASYTVQVGAFRQKKQVDAKADVLKSIGFDCRIEPPESEEGLYLLKVGRFKSRAEAVAMQLRLKKSGWGSFIKTN
jgi:cell division protein FtsN